MVLEQKGQNRRTKCGSLEERKRSLPTNVFNADNPTGEGMDTTCVFTAYSMCVCACMKISFNFRKVLAKILHLSCG